MRTPVVLVGFLLIAMSGAWPTVLPAADSTADKQAEEAREKIWNSSEMLQARAWLESYFAVAKKYTPQQAAAYRDALKNMSAPEMELWLMKFEHDREVSRAQEAAWEAENRVSVARDQRLLDQERRQLQNANRGAGQAAAGEERVISEERREAERNYSQNAAAQNQYINNEYNRPYVPYYNYGYRGPGAVHYHFHR